MRLHWKALVNVITTKKIVQDPQRCAKDGTADWNIIMVRFKVNTTMQILTDACIPVAIVMYPDVLEKCDDTL